MSDTRVEITNFEKVMIRKLNDCTDLSHWEAEFIASLERQGHMSTAQEDKLHEIYDRRFL